MLLTKEELRRLANLGALNCFAEHRRAAMWKVEETPHDDLLTEAGHPERKSQAIPMKLPQSFRDEIPRLSLGMTSSESSPLPPNDFAERVQADYEAMDLTTGPHPMKLVRAAIARYLARD